MNFPISLKRCFYVFILLIAATVRAQVSPDAFVSIESPTGVNYILSVGSTQPDGAVFTYINFNTSELDVMNPTVSSNGTFSGSSPITGRTLTGQITGNNVTLTYNGATKTATRESIYGPTRKFAGTYIGPIFHPTVGAASLQVTCSSNGKLLAFSFFGTQVDAGVGTIQTNGNFSVRLLSGRTASGNLLPVNGIAKGSALFSTGETQTYTLVKANPSKLANISTRGFVGSGEQVLIGGFIITEGAKGILITAKGPSLSSQGIANPLQDPRLDLYLGSTLIASNSSWTTNSNATQIAASGAAPTNNREAALQLNLEPGAYTVVVSSEDASTGVGIVEVFGVGGPTGN